MLFGAAILESNKHEAACRNRSPDQNCERTFDYVGHAAVPPISGVETPPRKPKAERDEWRSEQDLQAQWDMARWAFWSAVAGIMGLFVGTAGIVFVAQTLKANRDAVAAAEKAIEISHETARYELRAYLVTKDCVLHYEENEPVAVLTVTNCGQTPAERVMVVGAVFIVKMPATIMLASFDENLSKGRLGRDRNFELVARMKKPITQEQIEGLENRTHTLVVTGDIEYTDIFGRVWAQNYEFCTGGRYGPPIREGRMSTSTKDFRERQKA